MFKTIFLFLTLLVAPFAVAEHIVFGCKFPYFSDLEQAKQTQETPFTATFIVTIDNGSSTALVVGNNGAEDVMVTSNGEDLYNFIEITGAGVLNTTTILLGKDGSANSAVHSRHASVLGLFMPTQWYGSCDVV